MIETWRLFNILAFIGNICVAYCIGAPNNFSSKFGLKTNKEISEMYPTLITPAGWAFAIWGLIFSLQGMSMIWQCMFQEDSVVGVSMKLVSGTWIASCILQCVWTLLFALNRIWSSLVVMIGILLCLGNIYINFHFAAFEGWFELIMMKLPFGIHFAWLIVATLANINIAITSTIDKFSIAILSSTAWLSLSVLGLGGIGLTLHFEDPVFCCVFAWASLAISRFEHPPFLLKRFRNKTRSSIKHSAVLISRGLVIFAVCFGVYLVL
jgi:translocator protein